MPHRYESLDWLRGLLALSILLYHVVSWEVSPMDASTLLGKLGAYGVSMFFILSGLSIAIAYQRFIVDAPSSARFFARRIFRIWPLLWVAVLVLSAARMAQGEPFGWSLIGLNLTTLFGFVSPTSYINTGAWSIGNEMVYYAMTPALILAYNRSVTLGNLVTAASVAVGAYFATVMLDPRVVLAEQWGVYVNPFNNLFLYCAGIALHYNASALRLGKPACLALLAAGASVFLVHPVTGNQIHIVTGWNRLAFSAASILIVFAAYQYRGSGWKLLSAPLTQMGLATYGIYLLHPIVWEVTRIAFRCLGMEPIPLHVVTATILITLPVAWAFYQWFERRFIHWGKSVTTPREPVPDVTAAPLR